MSVEWEGVEVAISGYPSRLMNMKPVLEGRVARPETLLERLAAGEAARFVLQPGDMTRYEFYLVPQWLPELRSDQADGTLVCVVPLNNKGEVSWTSWLWPTSYDMKYSNDWTREVVSSFVRLIGKTVTEMRAELLSEEG